MRRPSNRHLRNVKTYLLDGGHQVAFGLELSRLANSYDYTFGQYSDLLGQETPALAVRDRIQANRSGLFANCRLTATPALAFTLGLHSDYFSYNQSAHLAPYEHSFGLHLGAPRNCCVRRPSDALLLFHPHGVGSRR